MKVLNKPNDALITFIVGSGGVLAGQLAMVSAATAIVATEGVATAIVIGVACADYAEGDIGLFEDLRGATIEFPINTAGATDVFADAGIGTAYDVYVASDVFYLDPNDTTGAMFYLQSYDNARLTCTAKIIPTLLYI